MLHDPSTALDQTVRSQPAALAAALVEAGPRAVCIATDHGRAAAIAAAARALDPARTVILYSASDALPGEGVGASPANIGERMAALNLLNGLPGDTALLVVAPIEATIDRVAPADAFSIRPPVFATGDAIDVAGFGALAEGIGYHVDDRVDEPAEYSVRGGVVDIFPVDAGGAVRLTHEDGRVVSIDRYDPITQRSVETLERVAIGRAAEPDAPRTATLLDHLAGVPVLVEPDAEARRARLVEVHGATGGRRGARAIVDDAAWAEATGGVSRIEADGAGDVTPRFVERGNPLAAFTRFAAGARREGVLVLAGVERDLRFLRPRVTRSLKTELLAAADWSDVRAATAGSVLTIAAPLDRGFAVQGVTVVAAADLLGGRAARDDVPTGVAELMVASELGIGDLVVHEQFGIGRVCCLETLPDGSEAIVLDYAKGGRRLVPPSEAFQLWRYGADGEAVALDSLDGSSWQKRRGAIDVAVAESAAALTALSAERDARRTDPVVPEAAAYERFASGFAFTETPDQARAIAAVRADLASGRPMDRLVVGDVGYGKTEVALRAAAVAALAGRQVAIAAPTTVLARQHLETFRRRFAGTGVVVEGLSRLTGAAEAKRVRAGLADGSVRVVVGTGAVGGKGVSYADLALVVIDEEQRFGAADKAKLRDLGAGHLLLLSATPIPRTLQNALVGLQDVSVIATPPARRQPIRTVVGTLDDATVPAALMRESARGGQSFVVVPRIEDMAPLEERLRRLVPELGIVTAHGKMPAAAIDEAMVAFAAGDGDVLLATNIIEAGLDVPRANTMIVHRADRFGLAQLHQLRGRVGRGGRRGQILLTTEPGATIAERTLERLRTLQAFDRLGAGFAISARDLDMRGAGDLLGEEQAGHMKLIGIDLYQHLLSHALAKARGQATDRLVPQLNLGTTGHLPSDWIPEENIRLGLYARLARLDRPAAVDQFEAGWLDRFGALPAAAARLLEWSRVRLLAEEAGVARLDAGPAAIAFTVADGTGGWPAPEVELERKGDRWLLRRAIADEDERLAAVRDVLDAATG